MRTTKVLDVSENSLLRLHEDSFAALNLLNLQKIFAGPNLYITTLTWFKLNFDFYETLHFTEKILKVSQKLFRYDFCGVQSM